MEYGLVEGRPGEGGWLLAPQAVCTFMAPPALGQSLLCHKVDSVGTVLLVSRCEASGRLLTQWEPE